MLFGKVFPNAPFVPRKVLQRPVLLVLATLLALLGAFSAPPSARAFICTVPGTYPTIQAALGDTACATINVGIGTFHENLSIWRDVVINGSGSKATTINGGGANTTIAVHTPLNHAPNVTLNGLTITGGGNVINGGGINNLGVLTVTNSVITGNSATGSGGGIYNPGNPAQVQLTLTVIDSTISGNSAPFGAGLVNEGLAAITDSTISGNHADHDGGGILDEPYLGSYPELWVTNSTLSGNTAKGYGGGIASSGNGILYLTYTTVADNVANLGCTSIPAGTGGGVSNQGTSSTVNLFGTLMAHNTFGRYFLGSCISSPEDCGGTFDSQGYNLLGVSTDCTIIGTTTGNLIGAEPQLGPLQNNGGPTSTRALLAGSPGLDRIPNSHCAGITTDQRGWPRPYPSGGSCDIGAYERAGFLYLPLVIK